MRVNSLFAEVRRILVDYFSEAVGESDGMLDMIYQRGFSHEALMYSAIFLPQLCEVEGSVVFWEVGNDRDTKKRFVDHMKSAGRVAAEKSFSFTEVPYLFCGAQSTLDDSGDFVLASVIASSWRAHLLSSYQDREFVVEVIPPESSGSVVALSFWEDRSGIESQGSELDVQ